MQCNFPRLLRFDPKSPSPRIQHAYLKYRGQEIYVPCGKCLACRKARSFEWSVRILHELQYYDKSCFVTLTYNDENLPKNNSVIKEHLQLFFKRLRKILKKRQIKYYACGEYGEQKKRPHYHAIIFGLDLLEHEFTPSGIILSGVINDCWKYGLSHIGYVSHQTAQYVAQYLDKKYFNGLAEKVYTDTGREIPFQLQSLGLGLRYCLDNREALIENLSVTLNGVPSGLPRYYQKKLNIDKSLLLDKALDKKIHILNSYVMRKKITEPWDIAKIICKVREQRETSLSKQTQIFHSKRKKM